MANIITAIASTISKMEGDGPNTLARRNNNPGNLRPVGGSGFRQFATWEQGWAALENQVRLNINRGLTLEEFFAGKPGVYGGYAPAADSNRPLQYAQFVSAQTGIPLSVPLDTLTSGSFQSPAVNQLPSLPANQPGSVNTWNPFSGLFEKTNNWGSSNSITRMFEESDTTTLLLLAGVGILLVIFVVQD